VKRGKAACLLLSCLLLAGCGLLSAPKPEPVQAVLSKLPDGVPHAPAHNVTLLVAPPEASPAYDTTRMAYTVRPYEIGYFRDNEWAETPAQSFGELLVRAMRETGYFKAVLTSQAATGASFRLQATIVELLQDHTVKPPVLRLALHVQLFGAAGQPIADREIRRDQPMLEPTPYAGVTAANEATALALRDVAQLVLDAVRGSVARRGSIF
jgi:cholesterol transport system auxiliary component